jgi:aryl-alcohol dehydrogenase-like predicted oxidoreductase
MRYRRLGGTGLAVSRTVSRDDDIRQRGRPVQAGRRCRSGADALVERSLAAGINLFDTADCYSSGASEQILGRSLKTIGVKRSDVIIATKVSSDV